MTPKIPPKKFMWVPFLRSFTGNEAHKLVCGGRKWEVFGGGQKAYVENVYVLFPSLRYAQHKFLQHRGAHAKNSGQIPSEFRANSEQASQTPLFLVGPS